MPACTERREGVDLQAVIETQALVNDAGLSPTEVMEVIVQRTRLLTGADGTVVELADGDEMVYAAVSGSAQGSLGLRLGRDGSLSGLCVATGRVLQCQDTELDPRVDRDACRRVGVRSMVVAPLAHRGTTIGALKVLASVPGGFDDTDVATLRVMAGFMAASITHARQFEELSRLNDALDDFSAHVAHDLRNHIAVVRMASAELRRLVSGNLPDATELVEVVEQQADRSSELIVGLLELARASRTPTRVPFDLAAVVEEAAQGIGGLELEKRCDGVNVVADRLAVRQALTNLFANSARYAGGEAGPAVVTVECHEDGEGWRLRVVDRGPGLQGEDRERVFRAFERGRSSGTVEGSGLGLAIVAAVAEAHRGEVGYEPTAGGGSTFWFFIPRTG
jgi:signal transduction histidine kinase